MSNINVVQSYWNFAQLKEIKNKQVATTWSLELKKQRFGATLQSPEDLENTPFKSKRIKFYKCKLFYPGYLAVWD